MMKKQKRIRKQIITMHNVYASIIKEKRIEYKYYFNQLQSARCASMFSGFLFEIRVLLQHIWKKCVHKLHDNYYPLAKFVIMLIFVDRNENMFEISKLNWNAQKSDSKSMDDFKF